MRIIDDDTAELTEGEVRVLALEVLHQLGEAGARAAGAFVLELRAAALFDTGMRRLTEATTARVGEYIRGARRVYALLHL